MDILPSEFLSLSLLKSVVLEAGMYPAAMHMPDGSGYTSRSDWHNGHNAAVMEMSSNWHAALKWSSAFSEEERVALGRLVNLGILDIDIQDVFPEEKEKAENGETLPMLRDRKDLDLFKHRRSSPPIITTTLNCNDTFAWASADAEDIHPSQWKALWLVYEKYHNDGLTAFASFVRKEEPMPQLKTEGFRQALLFVEELLHPAQPHDEPKSPKLP